MMQRLASIFVSILLAGASSAFAAKPEKAEPERKPLNVLLTVEERANVARRSQPVTAGVPLPKGLMKDTGKLRIVDRSGNDVPAQFTILNLWHPGKSVRWVRVDFQASVPVGAVRYFYLRDDGSGTTKAEGIEVRQKDGRTVVDTGTLAAEFSDGSHLFRSESLGTLRMLMHTAGGSEIARSYTVQSTHTVEFSGPLHTVVKLEGKFVPWDGKTAEAGSAAYLNHVTRLHLYKDKPFVRIVHTIENLKGNSPEDIASATSVDRCELEITPAFVGDVQLNYRFGTAGADAAGAAAPNGSTAGILQDSSDHYTLTGSALEGAAAGRGEGRGKSVKPVNLGFMDVSDGKTGVLVGIKYFWEMWPKALELSPGKPGIPASIRAYLVPHGGTPGVKFVPGLSRTHEMIVHLHKAGAPAEEVRSAWMFLRKPLFAACPTEWYCQETRAFGRIVDGNLKSYKVKYRLLIKRYDDFVARSIDAIQKGKELFDTVDSYGFFHFGDLVRGVWQGARPRDGSAAKTSAVRWNNNAEDFPHLLAIQFARTAELRYLDLLIEHGRHMADVCTYRKFPGNSNLDGTSRPWGAREHFRDGEGEDGEIQSKHYGFYQVQGMLDLYHLTGDLRARDMGVRAATRCRRTRYSGVREVPLDERTNYAVSGDIANAMLGALAGYRETGERDFLAVADLVLNRNRKRAAEWQFADAYGGDVEIHAVAELFELTGKADYREIILSCARHAWEDRKQAVTPPMAGFWGLASVEAGNPRYIERVVDSLNQHTRLAPARQPARFARGAAMLPQAFWYLTDLPPK